MLPYLVLDSCPLNGPSITFSGPLSLVESDAFYTYGYQVSNAYELFQQWLHFEREIPGISFNGTNYCAAFYLYEDSSSSSTVSDITTQLVQNGSLDVFLGPITSFLTTIAISITEANGYLALAPVASTDSVFIGKDLSFAIMAPASELFDSVLKSLSFKGAKTVAHIYENSVYNNELCGTIQTIIDDMELDMTVVDGVQVSFNASYSEISAAITQIQSHDTDIDLFFGCTYYDVCLRIIKDMKEKQLNVNAMIFITCTTFDSFTTALGNDSMYTLSGVQWSELLEYEDDVSGWTNQKFVSNFYNQTNGVHATYHAAGAFAMMEAITIAIERAQSLDPPMLAIELAKLRLNTIYGRVEFDENNMNQVDPVYVQITESLDQVVVLPDDAKTGSLVYPMPSWSTRACWDEYGDDACICDVNCPVCTLSDVSYTLSSCDTTSGLVTVKYSFIDIDGCRSDLYSLPADENVGCGYVPYSSPAGIAILVISSLVTVSGIVLMIFVMSQHQSTLIQANQPKLLTLFTIGSIVLSVCTIFFLGLPTVTYCSLRIVLLSIGFSLMFGSLLVIVYRVWKVFGGDKLSSTKSSSEFNTLQAVAIMLLFDVLMIVIWLLAFPVTVKKYETGSVVSNETPARHTDCVYSDQMLGIKLSYKILQLSSACVLSYRTRNVDKRLLQSNLIMIATFNISLVWLFFVLINLLNLSIETIIISCVFCILTSALTGQALIVFPKYLMLSKMSKTDGVVASSDVVSKSNDHHHHNETIQTIQTRNRIKFAHDAIFSPHEIISLIDKGAELEASIMDLMNQYTVVLAENVRMKKEVEMLRHK